MENIRIGGKTKWMNEEWMKEEWKREGMQEGRNGKMKKWMGGKRE